MKRVNINYGGLIEIGFEYENSLDLVKGDGRRKLFVRDLIDYGHPGQWMILFQEDIGLDLCSLGIFEYMDQVEALYRVLIEEYHI